MNNKITLIIASVVAIVLIMIFAPELGTDTTLDVLTEEMTEEQIMKASEEMGLEIEKIEDVEVVDWRQIEMKDVITGETYKVADFSGQKLFLESFAVWCPTCRKQQDNIKDFHEDFMDIMSISIDTDPNEDEAKVLAHAQRYEYDWRFSISPTTLTRSLIDEFGITVVNAPGAPVILICEDQTARLLPRGLKGTGELKEEVEKGC